MSHGEIKKEKSASRGSKEEEEKEETMNAFTVGSVSFLSPMEFAVVLRYIRPRCREDL